MRSRRTAVGSYTAAGSFERTRVSMCYIVCRRKITELRETNAKVNFNIKIHEVRQDWGNTRVSWNVTRLSGKRIICIRACVYNHLYLLQPGLRVTDSWWHFDSRNCIRGEWAVHIPEPAHVYLSEWWNLFFLILIFWRYTTYCCRNGNGPGIGATRPRSTEVWNYIFWWCVRI